MDWLKDTEHMEVPSNLVYKWQTNEKKKKKAPKAKCKRWNVMNLLQNSQYSWNMFFFRKRIWILLELVRSKTQDITIIDQEKHKIKQIDIWNSMTTWFIMRTITTATIIPSFKFVFPQVTSSSCFISFTFLDEHGKLACSQCMGLHSLIGRALQR